MNVILAVIAIVGFIGTFPQFFGSSWGDIYRLLVKGTIPWDVVHEAALKLLNRMRNDDFIPTVVVGIGRGGILATGLICSEYVRGKLSSDMRKLDTAPELPLLRIATINTTVVFKMRPIGRDVQPRRALVDRIDLHEIDCVLSLEDRILLLVAQNFTGSTLEKAVALIEAKGISRENIKTATLFWQKPKVEERHLADVHEPDLFGMVIPASKTMPWKSKLTSTDRM